MLLQYYIKLCPVITFPTQLRNTSTLGNITGAASASRSSLDKGPLLLKRCHHNNKKCFFHDINNLKLHSQCEPVIKGRDIVFRRIILPCPCGPHLTFVVKEIIRIEGYGCKIPYFLGNAEIGVEIRGNIIFGEIIKERCHAGKLGQVIE